MKTKDKKSWIKRHPIWSLVILLVFLNLLFLGAILPEDKKESTPSTVPVNSYQESQQTASPTQTSMTWHSVTSFDGTNSKKTDTFYIRGNKFKLIYDVNPANEYAIFYLTIYREGDSYLTDMVSLNSGSDESIIYEGEGNFYLDINAANLDDWKIRVEDYY